MTEHNAVAPTGICAAVPITAVDILIHSYQLAKAHDSTDTGRCLVCDDPADCRVRLDPNGRGFLIPVP